MLYDRSGGFVEFKHQVPRCVGIQEIVVAKLFPMKELRSGYSKGRFGGSAIQRGALVRILAIAEVCDLLQRQHLRGREALRSAFLAPSADQTLSEK